ncbi:MAG: phytoene desaturase family protein [Ignavibacteria bacterium]
MKKTAIVVGAGLGGLSTALRLTQHNFKVTIVEKYYQPGGRLNQLKLDGFTFDVGPSFMSMTYELDELFNYINEKNPLHLEPLDPLYNVFFEGRKEPFRVWKDLNKLEEEFIGIEKDISIKVDKFLNRAGQFFHDTINTVVKQNFNNKIEYILQLAKVPKKHIPYLIKSIWNEVSRTFESNELRVIFSLVAFFLGSTPFRTPAIYTLLNYTEMRHNGYWKIAGGMYRLVDVIMEILKRRGVNFIFNSEIVDYTAKNDNVINLIDQNGNKYEADVFIINSDAAFFRGKVLRRKNFSEEKLDKLDWTMAPFTIYLGVEGKISSLAHHNYFLGNNFKGYASKIFTSSISPQKPYYYVNVLSKSEPQSAPMDSENIFILCPVPDLRFKPDWSDSEELADNIINDLSNRIEYDIKSKIKVMKIFTPIDWQNAFNLYKGSGLGLAHGINQVGAFRPKNKDEVFKNLYYVGASTIPGTGLPMVIISSKLVTERILNDRSLQ